MSETTLIYSAWGVLVIVLFYFINSLLGNKKFNEETDRILREGKRRMEERAAGEKGDDGSGD